MIVFLNGEFVEEQRAAVSVFDRGFLYGDGLFETVLVLNRRPLRWEQHWERLWRGAEYLKIPIAFGSAQLQAILQELLAKNAMADALVRLMLSRGVAGRGYSPKSARQPTFVMTLHPAPIFDQAAPRWRLVTSTVRLPANEPLAQFKTCNKLPQILARAEADAAGADEALLLNTDGNVVEAASSNLFWIERGMVCTPPLASGVLPGVTRAIVLDLCLKLGLESRQAGIMPDQLFATDGVFLSVTSAGIAEGVSLDGQALSVSPLTERLRRAYLRLLHQEMDP